MRDGRRAPRAQACGAEHPVVPGITATIAQGLSLVLARPLLLLIPLLCDLGLWLGVQVSVRPFTDGLGGWMIANGGADGRRVAEELQRVGQSWHLNDLIGAMLPSVFAGAAKDTLLTALLAFIAPPLVAGVDRDTLYGDWGQGLAGGYTPASGWWIVGVGLLFLLAASALTILYRVPLAQAVRGGAARSPLRLVRTVLMAWVRLISLLVVMGVAGCLVVGPVVFVAALFLFLGINLVPLIGLGLLFAAAVAALYLLFALDAIVVSEVGPLRALSLSSAVVRRNVGQAAGFGLATLLIATGLPQLWPLLVGSPPGIAIALIGNAFVGTGLVLASMTFYRDRLSYEAKS